jgi:hypothetical protein
VIFLLSRLWGKLEALHITAEGLVDHSTLRNDDFYWKVSNNAMIGVSVVVVLTSCLV